MDDITPNAVQRRNAVDQPIGCSSICVNQLDCVSLNSTSEFIDFYSFSIFFPWQEILAHTEDALKETLNHFYLVSAHIIELSPQGKHKVRINWNGIWWRLGILTKLWNYFDLIQVTEERFTSLCYAGHLPGYTMGYNHHGLVYSINTLSAATLHSGKTRKYKLSLKINAISHSKTFNLLSLLNSYRFNMFSIFSTSFHNQSLVKRTELWTSSNDSTRHWCWCRRWLFYQYDIFEVS